MINPFISINDLLSDVTGNTMHFNAAAHAAPMQQPATPAGVYNVRGLTLNDRDLQTLRNVLFAEISNRDPQKQQLEARTIINTALNRIPQYHERGNKATLHDVLSMPNQYQGYNSREFKRITNNATTTVDAPKLKAIDDTIGQLKSGQFEDNTGGRVFYRHDGQGQILLKDGPLYKQPAVRTFAALNK